MRAQDSKDPSSWSTCTRSATKHEHLSIQTHCAEVCWRQAQQPQQLGNSNAAWLVSQRKRHHREQQAWWMTNLALPTCCCWFSFGIAALAAVSATAATSVAAAAAAAPVSATVSASPHLDDDGHNSPWVYSAAYHPLCCLPYDLLIGVFLVACSRVSTGLLVNMLTGWPPGPVANRHSWRGGKSPTRNSIPRLEYDFNHRTLC